MEQFLTAVFELRPTRRKAAMIERIRASAEDVFWDVMARLHADAEAAAALDRKERRAATGRLGHQALVAAAKAGLCEPVAQGLARDLVSAAGAYIEARARGRAASWPAREIRQDPPPLGTRLDAMAAAITQDAETASRDALNLEGRMPRVRPIILARSRDCQIIRDAEGRLAVALNIVRASDPRARDAVIHAGTDACTGEAIKASRRKTVLLVPLACSKWHEHKFLSGRMRLGSAIVYPRDGRWWLQAQFGTEVPEIAPTGRVVGMDRGVVNVVALAVVDATGAVLDVPGRRSRRFFQRLRRAAGATRSAGEMKARTRIGRRVDNGLHLLANEVVAIARRHGARVAVERLDGLKTTMATPRAKGARKGGWGTVLRKAQLAKLETLLAYKLNLAGLPPLREVLAAGTSTTCAACGHRDPKNRPDQAGFRCEGCGFELNADENAAVLIARRGLMEIKKGDKLDALHRDMVAGLAARDDGGLGPLASCQRVVAVRAAADGPNAPEDPQGLTGLNPSAGQNVSRMAVENPPRRVVAARDGRILAPEEDRRTATRSATSSASRSGGPRNAD